jgi:predicted nucleotidyltransferase
MNLLNEDFQDFIIALNKYGVRYILVGGYAVVVRGYSRSTGDMDVWVEKSETNYNYFLEAIHSFGIPIDAISRDKFFSTEFDVFAFGKPPYAIEIMTAVKGLDFEPTYNMATWEEIDGIKIKVIHLNHLIEAKKAAGRNKDLNDIENLPEGD